MTKEEAKQILSKRGIKITEFHDFADRERTYNNMDAYEKFQQYQQMDFNNLTDDQKEEFFELWKEFKNNK